MAMVVTVPDTHCEGGSFSPTERASFTVCVSHSHNHSPGANSAVCMLRSLALLG